MLLVHTVHLARMTSSLGYALWCCHWNSFISSSPDFGGEQAVHSFRRDSGVRAACETTRCRRIGSGLGGGVASSLFPRTRAVGTVPSAAHICSTRGAPANHRLVCSLPLLLTFSSVRYHGSAACSFSLLSSLLFLRKINLKKIEKSFVSTRYGAGVSVFQFLAVGVRDTH